MIVWQLRRCEEYFMQEDLGLYETKALALSKIPNAALVIEYETETTVVCRDAYHYAKPSTDRIVARDGTVITADNVREYLESFEFYDLIHAGYPIYGVFAVEVQSS